MDKFIYANLWIDLAIQGRPKHCEICHTKIDLSLHHIVPIKTGGESRVCNLAILCKKDHALVERFYWNERTRLVPEEALEIKLIARRFKYRQVPEKQLDSLKNRTKNLWLALNTHPTSSSIEWWHNLFERAKDWASTQEILRFVPPEDAITEDPWFKLKETPTFELHSSS